MAYSTIYYLADWPILERTWRSGGPDAVEDALEVGVAWLTFYETWPDDPRLFMPTSSAQIDQFLVAWTKTRERLGSLDSIHSILCQLGAVSSRSRPPIRALGQERLPGDVLAAIPPADAADLLGELSRIDLDALDASIAAHGHLEPVMPAIRWVRSLLAEAVRLQRGVLVFCG
ncbi:MAG: hypothetical protein AAGC60_17740 [Acidobacteriota bacterium]